MTEIQRQALRMLDDQNIGCLLVAGFGWVWPTDIRNDFDRYGEQRAIDAADAVVTKLTALLGTEAAI